MSTEFLPWGQYPIGTKAHALGGGYWIKTNLGWKWCTGSTFPTPGAHIIRVEWPLGPTEQAFKDLDLAMKYFSKTLKTTLQAEQKRFIKNWKDGIRRLRR